MAGAITHQTAQLNASYLISKYCDRVDDPLKSVSGVSLGGGCEMKWGNRLGETVYWATCSATPVLSGSALVTALQKELDRVGCDPGSIDGRWGNHTKEALEQFNRFAKLSVPADTPTMQALTALKGVNKQVCPSGSRPKLPQTTSGSGLRSLITCCLAYCRLIDCNSPPASTVCSAGFIRRLARLDGAVLRRTYGGDTYAAMKRNYSQAAFSLAGVHLRQCR